MNLFHRPLLYLSFKGFISNDLFMSDAVSSARKDYAKGALHKEDLPANPMLLLNQWVADAAEVDPEDYNAMCIATHSLSGGSNGRIVLLRALEDDCLRFFTNYESEKGKEILASPQVACIFFWKELERQLRVRGKAVPSSDAVSDAYFASRPRSSQIGAWASRQSRQGEEVKLTERINSYKAQFEGQDVIPRPPFWGGFDIYADEIEFWQGRPSRLHNRYLYTKQGPSWSLGRLDP